MGPPPPCPAHANSGTAAKPQFVDTIPHAKGWAPRINFVMVYLKDRLFLMGGKLFNGTYANDIWSTGYFQDGQNPWDFDGDALWSGREGHQAVVHTVNNMVCGALAGTRLCGVQC